MSNTLTNLVPSFNGKDFKSYAKKMEAYLAFQGIDNVLTEDKPSPVVSSSGGTSTVTNEEERKQFDVNDRKARGAIVMRCDERIIDNVPKEDMKTAKKLWAYLNKEYGKAQLADIFGYLQTALNAQFNERQHPDPQLNVVIQQFTRLKNENVAIPDFLQAMILLAIARVKPVTTSLLQNYQKDTLKVSTVRDALLAHYSQQTMSSSATAQKFNTKRKRDDPKFSNQQQGGSSAPKKGDNAEKKNKNRGKRSGKNSGKGKGGNAHAHGVSEMAGMVSSLHAPAPLTPSVPATKTSHVALITPSGTSVRTVTEKPPVKNEEAVADNEHSESSRAVFDFAKELDITVTPERFRRLDKIVNDRGIPRVVDQDEEMGSPTPKASGSNLQLEDVPPPAKRARLDSIPDVDMASAQQNDESQLFDEGSTLFLGSSGGDTIDLDWSTTPFNSADELLQAQGGADDDALMQSIADSVNSFLLESVDAANAKPAARQVPFSSSGLLRKSHRATPQRVTSVAAGTVLHSLMTCSHEFCTNIFCVHSDIAACPRCKGKSPAENSGAFPPLWMADSGASLHVTADESDLAEYEPIEDSEPLQTASASASLRIVGRGTAFIDHYVTRHGEKVLMTSAIYPVHHVPGLHGRLISLGTLLKQSGLQMRGNAACISLHRKNSPLSIMEFTPSNPFSTIYWLWCRPSVTKTLQTVSLIYKVDYDTMHRRFAHPSKDVLRHARNSTKGFPQDLEFPADPRPCKGCAEGKMHARSFPSSEHRATKPFEKIHSDLKQFPTVSYHKYRYFMSFFDEALSYGWTVCLKQKSDAKQAMRNFIAMVRNQFDTTIKKWHIDNGGEFQGMGMEEFLEENGILVEKGAPYAHQQNGRAERFNRTIMDKAESMRFTACLPNSFWEFAILHAARVYNWTPIRRLKWKTPHEALYKEKPDISHLRVFGCGAYVFIPEEKRQNKLSPKAELMTYLGMSDGVKGFLFMRSNTALFVGTQATFDEALFPRCPDSTRRQHVPVGEDFPLRDDDPADPQDPPQESGDMPSDDDEDFPPPPPAAPAPPFPPQRGPDDDDDDQNRQDPPHDRRDQTPEAAPPAPKRGKGHKKSGPPPEPTRKSTRVRTQVSRPDNAYGDRAPAEIERDVSSETKWRKMVGDDEPRSSRSKATSDAEKRVPGPSSQPPSRADAREHLGEDEDRMAKLCREGGVELITELLSKAVPVDDDALPDTSKIRDWTFKDILKLPSAQQKEWMNACREELEALRQRKVYSLVERPKGRKVIKCRWVFDQKSDGRKRARLVAKGFSQVEGIDYDEIFSPVVRYETFRLVMALAALEGWHWSGLDVSKAFLYGDLDEEVYMEQPEGFAVKGQERKVMRLHKAIYGLKQAALSWWKALTKSTKAMGWVRLTSDAGVFFYQDSNGKLAVIVVYVDDALFFSKDKKLIAFLKAEFNKRWECRNSEVTSEFLRIRIRREGSKIKIDQIPYLDKVLKRFGMQNCKFAPTPLPAGYVPELNEDEVDPELRKTFQSVIGSLLFIMLGSRSDIAFAVTKLSQFAANPSRDHLNKALYICRYLAGTRDYALVYDGASNGGLTAYTDSDWASDPIKRRSTTGYFMKLANGIICWQSRLQRTVAASSTEAEYMALSDCSRQVMWLKSILMELKRKIITPVPIHGDNQGSLFTGSNAYRDRRMKHIDIRYHYIRELVEEKEVELYFIDGNNNPADMFTKNLGRVKFEKFRSQLGLEFNSS